uniref:MalT-like TPR region domain-containing protein n=1 Tax=Leersia perrieri TaxID=77586 RepID=A0A0D9XXL0_9ORYZ
MPPPLSPAASSAAGKSPLPPPTTTTTTCSRISPTSSSPTRRQLLVSNLLLLLATPRRAAAAPYDPVSPSERAASASTSRRVGEAIRLLDLGRTLQARGDYAAALAPYTAVAREYGDLALAEYARVGRALALYEVGDRDDAIAEMEDVSVALRGYPEIHAALAAALYADKHAPLLAENQFAIATLLDPHYTDLAYVRDTKHWPPSLVDSLQHFITLS